MYIFSETQSSVRGPLEPSFPLFIFFKLIFIILPEFSRAYKNHANCKSPQHAISISAKTVQIGRKLIDNRIVNSQRRQIPRVNAVSTATSARHGISIPWFLNWQEDTLGDYKVDKIFIEAIDR